MRAILCALLLLTGPALANDGRPPDLFADDGSIESRPIAHDVVKTLRLGALEIEPEATKLESVIAAMGAGTVRNTGDAATSLAWLCYRFAQKGTVHELDLTSDEMGGGIVINGFVLQAAPSGPADRCPMLDKKFTPVWTAGLGLDSKPSEFLKTFGVPAKQEPARSVWSFESDARGQDEEHPWAVWEGVAVAWRDGRPAVIAVRRTTTD